MAQTILEQLIYYAPWVIAALVAVPCLYGLVTLTMRWHRHRWLSRRQLVGLELRPLTNEPVSLEATNKLFEVLHGLQAARHWKAKLWQHPVVFSLEITASKAQGIRYQLYVHATDAEVVEHAVRSYMPSVQVERIEADSTDEAMKTVNFRQTGHYAFPLSLEDERASHDPIAYLTGAMTKLGDHERMTLQYVAEPVRLPEADQIGEQVLYNEELVGKLRGSRRSGGLGVFRLINNLLLGALDTVGELGRPPTKHSTSTQMLDIRERQQIASRRKPARTLSVFEQQLVESMHAKVSQPLFRVSVRASVASSQASTGRQRITALKSAMNVYAVPKYQGLRATRRPRLTWPDAIANTRQRLRVPNILHRNTAVLSANELTQLYHFPRTLAQRPENVASELSRTLPAPVSLKGKAKLDLVLGQNIYHGAATDIGLTAAERERHVYIIGGTGNGKTTMLQYAAVQDIQSGKGLAVIDPHGDMAETLLEHVPPERIDDVIYFNPDDIAHPIGLNLLELHEGLAGDELLREKDLITESVVSVFRKIFSEEDIGGHRIEYVLRNAVQTALTVEGATLFTIFKLLNDPKFRKTVTKDLEDEDLRNFWKYELGKAGEFQRVKMAAGITAKIGRFLFSASAKRVLEQPKSTIDFDEIIDSGKILICNFSKGLLGEDTSSLFGITVLAKLQLAALRRARLKQAERRPFYLYVDEFQNFATASFVQMLSEARKYRLFMLMAEQSTSQQAEQRTVNIILANVGTVICFRTGNPMDERLLLPMFRPFIEENEISNLPPFSFYARLTATKAQEPTSGQTVLLNSPQHSRQRTTVIARSRHKHARRSDLLKPNTPTKRRAEQEKPKTDVTEPMIDLA